MFSHSLCSCHISCDLREQLVSHWALFSSQLSPVVLPFTSPPSYTERIPQPYLLSGVSETHIPRTRHCPAVSLPTQAESGLVNCGLGPLRWWGKFGSTQKEFLRPQWKKKKLKIKCDESKVSGSATSIASCDFTTALVLNTHHRNSALCMPHTMNANTYCQKHLSSA